MTNMPFSVILQNWDNFNCTLYVRVVKAKINYERQKNKVLSVKTIAYEKSNDNKR